jgi:hypothetical protein
MKYCTPTEKDPGGKGMVKKKIEKKKFTQTHYQFVCPYNPITRNKNYFTTKGKKPAETYLQFT